MAVKAWVGSADYQNEDIHGQIDAVLTKRSPGSTLKPFVYGLALDQGVLHPRTICETLRHRLVRLRRRISMAIL